MKKSSSNWPTTDWTCCHWYPKSLSVCFRSVNSTLVSHLSFSKFFAFCKGIVQEWRFVREAVPSAPAKGRVRLRTGFSKQWLCLQTALRATLAYRRHQKAQPRAITCPSRCSLHTSTTCSLVTPVDTSISLPQLLVVW